jgi:hypothetical protein
VNVLRKTLYDLIKEKYELLIQIDTVKYETEYEQRLLAEDKEKL